MSLEKEIAELIRRNQTIQISKETVTDFLKTVDLDLRDLKKEISDLKEDIIDVCKEESYLSLDHVDDLQSLIKELDFKERRIDLLNQFVDYINNGGNHELL